MRAEEVPDDWAERWKRFYFPVLIGGRLYVRPPWEEPAQRGGVEEVVIDPGGAFGTGTHPTTRMCLELLLEADEPGIVLRPRLRLGRAGDRGREAGLRSGARCRTRTGRRSTRPLRNARANGVEVEVRHVDLRREPAPVADAVAANLTAGLCEAVRAVVGERGDAARAPRSCRGSCARRRTRVAAALGGRLGLERTRGASSRRRVGGDPGATSTDLHCAA